ncbi:carbohydrate binding family 9 domain-containing protein [Candidatus Poribacteria bacterium]|nr:carbohydrate binding family 9 domain-containing protein [Candidatus Poribacteria bacterium]
MLSNYQENSIYGLVCCYLWSICLLFPLIAGADPGIMELQAEAYRTFQSIEIDGELSEPDWQNAKPIGHFVQYEPDEGKPATQPTEVRILYNDKHIYFGITCFDTDLSKLVANEMRRDAGLYDNDNVFVLLDTYNDRRSGFFFRVNPLGAMEDAAVTDNGDSQNEDWDAVWNCRTQINHDNWTAEIAIPFSQLRFNRSDDMTWGLNVGRTIRRNQEEGTWAPVSGAYSWRARYRTANIGSLTGLKGISPSRNLELLPYLLPGVSRTKEEDDNDTDGVFDIGLDVKYGLTSNLTADLTFNTDFAQVEADQEQVNLTRFSLFFPEKRPFFLEGAGLFDFGIPRTSFRRPPPLLLFYSRRIGIEEGYAVPIVTGGKITGKLGSYGVGLLNVFADEFHVAGDEENDPVDVPRTNYSVLRVKRDILSSSSIGVIAINKQNADTYNRAGGLDFVYRPADNLNVRGVWARTFGEDMSGRNSAWYLGSNWQKSNFRLVGSYMEIGENFNPEVGFVRRTGIRQFRGETRFTPFINKLGIRRIWTGPEFDIVLNEDNDLETRNITLSNWFEFERGGWISFQAQRTFERLDEEFEIRDEFIIPVGEYHFNSFRTSISTDDSKKISARVGANFGDFFNGERRGFDVGIDFRPNGRFSLEPRFQFNRVTLPDGSFNASIFGARMGYSFSTALFAKLFAQWNSDSDVVSTNFLLNYIYRPGSDFFLVFNQIYDNSGAKTELTDSTFVAKMTYWWNP